jgi:hypothetical protein
MQSSISRQPVHPPRGQPVPDYGAAVRDVQDCALDGTDRRWQGLFGEPVPPVPQPDWDWGPDNERRRR